MDASTASSDNHNLVITCEHGGNRISKRYANLFKDYRDLLNSHRGFDPGALRMAKDLAAAFSAPLVMSTISRLLVDMNRSIGHPHLHFEVISKRQPELRDNLLKQFYLPYRTRAEHLVRQAIADHGRVLHLSSHSFTPELDGKVRHADIGLLYDPLRPYEAALCEQWKAALKTYAPELSVRRNYPYQGNGDGLTSWFRQRLPADTYLGIELEINQKHIFRSGRHWLALRKLIVNSLHTTLSSPGLDFSI